MKYLLWAFHFVLLLDLSTSQDMEVPCKSNTDCQNLSNAPPGVACVDGLCKCRDDTGNPQNCAYSLATNSYSITNSSSRATAGLVGRFCTTEKECGNAETNAHCNLTRKQCQCNNEFVASTDFTKCLPAIAWNVSGCEIAKQCQALTANSTCSDRTCVCPTASHYDSNACWVNREFGANCSVTQECSNIDKAICDGQHRCSCPVNMVIHPNSTSCLPIASKIEDSCIESIQCTQLLGNGGVCRDQKCQCQEHHHYSETSYKCLNNLGIGAECQSNEECSDGQKEGGHGPMRCLENRCGCAEDFRTVDGLTCEPVLQQDPNSAGNRLGGVSAFATTLAYFVIVLFVL